VLWLNREEDSAIGFLEAKASALIDKSIQAMLNPHSPLPLQPAETWERVKLFSDSALGALISAEAIDRTQRFWTDLEKRIREAKENSLIHEDVQLLRACLPDRMDWQALQGRKFAWLDSCIPVSTQKSLDFKTQVGINEAILVDRLSRLPAMKKAVDAKFDLICENFIKKCVGAEN